MIFNVVNVRRSLFSQKYYKYCTMHVRVRLYGKPDVVVSVESKLTKMEKFRVLIQEKFNVKPNNQRLFYGGKLLENGYTFYDYKIKFNDVIQLTTRQPVPVDKIKEIPEPEKAETKKEEDSIDYKDAVSMFYTVGDFIDTIDKELGAWFEGRIVRIVIDPAAPIPNINLDSEDQPNKKKDPQIKQSSILGGRPKNGIEKHHQSSQDKGKLRSEEHLLFEVEINRSDSIYNTYCKLKDIRPRARNFVTVQNLKIGQTVMINHNVDYPREIGYWYDYRVSEIMTKRRNHQLMGTMYMGPDSLPLSDTQVRVNDKLFLIEEVIPLGDRTEEYKELMRTEPAKRSVPLNCIMCRDKDDMLCKECGCFICSGKELPETILLCDECNKGFHMKCMEPPLTELPEGDWYCKECKRDTNEVVAPGGAKQMKRQSTTNRDWGRGMACVGKTKTCSMPPNHFGPIPGVEVGMCWRFRISLSECGLHRPPVSGIHGRDVDGAYSIVLSGGYEDDVDNGNEFTYTGSGGRDLSGNKRTAAQSCDQTLTRENRALARNCAVKKVNEEGDDAGENWREGRPVRVVRSSKMRKHFPQYAPKLGNRYDGIYKVVKYYPEKGKSGFRVWKYLLRRDDPSPAPWEPGATQYEIVYPDGYLEAEAEKKALKELKAGSSKGKRQRRAPKKSNQPSDDEDGALAEIKAPGDEAGPSGAKPKRRTLAKKESQLKNPKSPPQVSIIDMLKTAPTRIKKGEAEVDENKWDSTFIVDKKTIAPDTLNVSLLDECPNVCAEKEKHSDGDLEAEGEMNAPKEMNAGGSKGKRKQRALQESNHSPDDDNGPLAKKIKESEDNENTCGPPIPKPKRRILAKKESQLKNPKSPPQVSIIDMLKTAPTRIKKGEAEVDENKWDSTFIVDKKTTATDTLNVSLLEECPNVCAEKEKHSDGDLEAKGEMNTSKEMNAGSSKDKRKQRALQSNHSPDDENRHLAKKISESEDSENACGPSSPKPKRTILAKEKSKLKISKSPSKVKAKPDENKNRYVLSEEEKQTIAMDTLNAPLWKECLDVCANKSKKEFVEHVSTVFMCNICQDVTASPVTTSCSHNFCQGCLKRALKAAEIPVCPSCRRNLSKVSPKLNVRLKAALRAIMPGYDANRA